MLLRNRKKMIQRHSDLLTEKPKKLGENYLNINVTLQKIKSTEHFA